jgi:hypothetical protein
MKKDLIYTFLMVFALGAHAQEVAKELTGCADFHKEVCGEAFENFADSLEDNREEGYNNEVNWKYDLQSRSTTFGVGDTSRFHMIAYPDQEYFLTVCAEELFGGEVHYKIYERKTEIVEPGEDEVEEAKEMASEDTSYYDTTAAYYDTSSYNTDEYSNTYSDPYSQTYGDNYTGYDSYNENYSRTGYTYTEDMQENKIKYELVEELLYDNAEDGNASTVHFGAQNTMSLVVEIVAPGEKPENKFKVEKRGCIGIYIQHARMRPKGY